MSRPEAAPRNQVLVGDALEHLRRLPAGCVDTVVTSPPYFALRDYGVTGQLGAEAHVEQWVQHLRTVLDELARVLAPHGSVWLNLGDSYSRGPQWGAAAKSLLLAPERLLLAAAGDGWLVRNKVVWAKTNPMPTSVRDRLAATWEPLYLLTRRPTYYFDLDAIRAPHRTATRPTRATHEAPPATTPTERPAWVGPLATDRAGLHALRARGLVGHPLGKNPGDVWSLASSGYRGAHFATFPETLVEPCLQATCPPHVCTACGVPWRRAALMRRLGHLAVTGDLQPACTCGTASRPGLVLDPFLGAGTTAVVAERLGRDWLGVELNADYAQLAEQRLRQHGDRAA